MVKQSKAKRGSAGQAQKLNALFGEDGIDGSTGRAYQPGPSRERKAPPSKEVFEPKRRPNAAIGKKKPAAGAAAPKEGALEPLPAKKQAPAKAAALQPRAAAVKNIKPAASTGDMVAKGKTKAAFDLSTKEGRSDYRLAIIADLGEDPEFPGVRDELEERAFAIVATFPVSEVGKFESDLVMSVGRDCASPLLMYLTEELFKQKNPEVSPQSYSTPGPFFARGCIVFLAPGFGHVIYPLKGEFGRPRMEQRIRCSAVEIAATLRIRRIPGYGSKSTLVAMESARNSPAVFV